jgi:hypothetical protein
MTDSDLNYTLTHPVYLDVSMMVSFLAYLEGGISTSEEETTTAKDARDRLIKGRSGFRFKLPAAIAADAAIEASGQRKDELSRESKTERHHTEASLFNVLYQYLVEDEKLTRLAGFDSLDSVESGQLVELSGSYLGNPLEEVLTFFGALLPYIDEQNEAKKNVILEALDAYRENSKSGNPAKRAQGADSREIVRVLEGALEATDSLGTDDFATRLIVRMAEDIEKAAVHDLLVEMSDGLRVVLTVSSEYYSKTTNEYLRAGQFRVIGKIASVLSGDQVINLTRRTVLGAAGPDMAKEIVQSVNAGGDVQLAVADPIVEAPSVQIIPMAIFL